MARNGETRQRQSRKSVSGERRRAESGERRAESGERRTEDGERRTESGELKRGTNGNRRVKSRSGERADGQVARRRRTSTKNGRTAGVPTGISGGKRRAASVDRQEEPTYYTNGRKQDDGKQTYNKGEHVEQTEAGGRRQEAGGRRQEAGGRRQEAGDRSKDRDGARPRGQPPVGPPGRLEGNKLTDKHVTIPAADRQPGNSRHQKRASAMVP